MLSARARRGALSERHPDHRRDGRCRRYSRRGKGRHRGVRVHRRVLRVRDAAAARVNSPWGRLHADRERQPHHAQRAIKPGRRGERGAHGERQEPDHARIAEILRGEGYRVAIVRHPMPYGDLTDAGGAALRLARGPRRAAHCTIEEREEYEHHLAAGTSCSPASTTRAILKEAEKEADVILWDGGNNDTAVLPPDLVDRGRRSAPGGSRDSLLPGRDQSLSSADVVVINKVDTAPHGRNRHGARQRQRSQSRRRSFVRAHSPITFVGDAAQIRGQARAVRRRRSHAHPRRDEVTAPPWSPPEARRRRDHRPAAVRGGEPSPRPSEMYPDIGPLLPAMGYGERADRGPRARRSTRRTRDCRPGRHADRPRDASPVSTKPCIARALSRCEEQSASPLSTISCTGSAASDARPASRVEGSHEHPRIPGQGDVRALRHSRAAGHRGDDRGSARAAAAGIGEPVVVKAQVLVGGRGKAGGVKIAKTPAEARREGGARFSAWTSRARRCSGCSSPRRSTSRARSMSASCWTAARSSRSSWCPPKAASKSRSRRRRSREAIQRVLVDPLLRRARVRRRAICAVELAGNAELARPMADIIEKLYRVFDDMRREPGRDQPAGRDHRRARAGDRRQAQLRRQRALPPPGHRGDARPEAEDAGEAQGARGGAVVRAPRRATSAAS